jgi:hypothetical protein
MKFASVEMPYLSRKFQDKMAVTNPSMRSDKKIAREALEHSMNDAVSYIPIASGNNWKKSEPFLCYKKMFSIVLLMF